MNSEKKSFLKSEYFFVIIIILVVMILNLFPYYYAYKISPPNLKFMGNFYYIDDYNTYLAKAAQGEEGNWLLVNKYASEVSKPRLIYTFYILMGHLARLLKANLENIFFISRIVLGIILLIVIYLFLKEIVKNIKLRKVIYLFICFSSGFGWLITSSFSNTIKGPNLQPIDLIRPESNPIERFTNVPHYLLAHTLLILTILFFIKSIDNKKYIYSIVAGFSALFLSFILPFHTILLYALLAVFLIYKFLRKSLFSFELKSFLIILFISLPSFLWMAWLAFHDPIWSEMTRQTFVSSPPFIYIIYGYGLLFPFAIIGCYRIFKSRDIKLHIIPIWFLIVFVLIYLPFKSQFRFLETAFYVPVNILAGYGLFLLFKHYFNEENYETKKFQFSRKFVIAIFIFTILGTVFLFNKLTNLLSKFPTHIYYEKQFLTDFDWIKNNIRKDAVILASYKVGNVIPRFTGNTVYIGHWSETLNLEDKLQKTVIFYKMEETSEQAHNFLQQNGIDYVIYGKTEKDEGLLDPGNYYFLAPVFQSDQMKIYQVN